MIFISSPRSTTDMQISKWGPIKHDPSTSITHCIRNTIARRVVRPSDHPMKPDRIARLVLSDASVLLCCVAPQSMYINPGAVFVGAGFPDKLSFAYCRPMGSHHIGTFPISFSLPGKHVQLFVPSRRVVMVPSRCISTTVASLVI
jgi:hypothetical protein